jgi:hypothetical protein
MVGTYVCMHMSFKFKYLRYVLYLGRRKIFHTLLSSYELKAVDSKTFITVFEDGVSSESF